MYKKIIWANDGSPTIALAIDRVAPFLFAEFDGTISVELVECVVSGARSDLGSDVPPEALPEFTHRLARQRLIDGHLLTAGGPCGRRHD